MILEYNLQFFAKDGPGGEKTEEPTSKKLEDARKEGQVAKSKELVSACELLATFALLSFWVQNMGKYFIGNIYDVYSQIPEFIKLHDGQVPEMSFRMMFIEMMQRVLLIMAPFLIVGFLIAVIVNLIQVKWKPTSKPLRPKFSKFNPVSGVKRLFSKDSLVELLKSILKIVVIGYVVYDYLRKHEIPLKLFYDIPLNQAIQEIGSLVIQLGFRISLFYLIVAIGDYVYQKVKFKNDMKMTKQEVKDEFKNTEGDPVIKGQQRKRMQEASQRRMMQDVPKADVVITNPTHFAVAVKYDAQKNDAPVVVAKGQDYVAQKIKEIARDNNIRIVENKPLARMLFHNVDLGAEIPPELYRSVAEILAMIYKENN